MRLKYWLLSGIGSIIINLIIMSIASPNFYASMGFDNTLKSIITVIKILLVFIVLLLFTPKSKKVKN